MKYNDQSIAENHSLYIAFLELRQKKYDKLRSVIFPDRKDYRRFRAACINLVLSTDIASPERTQLGKSKWKEAFGDPYETVERKLMKEAQKRKSIESPAQLLQDIEVVKAVKEDDESVSVTSHSSDDNSQHGRDVDLRKSKKRLEKGNNSTSSQVLSGKALKYHRRLSQAQSIHAPQTPRTARLGFRRSMDLSGTFIEAYNDEKRVSASTCELPNEPKIMLPPPEKIDDLRETVIMETIIKSADVAHNLQGFDQMVRWSSCLYLEQRKAYAEGRGEDPMNGWYDNQTGFLDFYILPLARKLDDAGAFGDTRGSIFVSTVEYNRRRWLKEGMRVTMNIVKKGQQEYPHRDNNC